MDNSETIIIRTATAQDKDFILSLIPRLVEFNLPDWRSAELMIATDQEILTSKLLIKPLGTIILIAEDEHQVPLGFIHIHEGADYYNREPHGHISDVIVSPAGEGRGIGKKLIAQAEEWARAQGYGWLTLSVFAQNRRARQVYERLGYGEDIIKYVKLL